MRLSIALISLLALGCSFSNVEVTECENTTECRDAFGVGFICQDDGFCGQAEAQPRCEKTFPPNLLDDPIAATSRILVGNLMDRNSTTHQARENSAELAYAAANDQSGIDGREFGVIFCTIQEDSSIDDLSRSDAAVASARYLADVVGVPAILGPAASSDTQAVFTDLQRTDEDILVISPSATSPALFELDPMVVTDENPGLLWRTAPPDSLQSAAIVFDMTTPGTDRTGPVTNVAVIFESGAYGDALGLRFVEEFQAVGGTAQQFPFDTESQRDEQVTTVGLDANFEEVLFISSQFTDAIAFLDAAASIVGFDTKNIFLTDAAANRDVLTTANNTRFPSVRGSRPAPLDETTDVVYANFLSSYSARFGADAKEFSFVANAYDAAWLITIGASWALRQESELTGTTIARGLRRVSSGDDIDILASSWTTIQNRFEAGESINVRGASGSLDFDPGTEETTGDFEIWRINGTSVEGIYSIAP